MAEELTACASIATCYVLHVQCRFSVLCGVMVWSLGGCATGVRPDAPTPSVRTASEGADQGLSDKERAEAYKRDVEDRAWRRHAEVIWINPPDERSLGDARRPRDILRNRTRR